MVVYRENPNKVAILSHDFARFLRNSLEAVP